MRRPGLAFLTLLGLIATGEARAQPVFAVVVGVNRSLDPSVPGLLYADDDAILFHQLLSGIGRSVILIDPDENTRRLHGETPGALLPTRANLTGALRSLLAEVARSRASGGRPVLYFFYSGHGDVKNNEGYLTLSDSRLSSADLRQLVLAPSRAVVNHVIVDACKSYFLVSEKRAGGIRSRAAPGFASTSSLLRDFPTTGFLLSTSSASNSHEWEEFQAGIFSHEVRSGLAGAADVNGDGRVSYNEMRAFLEVANSAIANERFRPAVFTRPPGEDGRVPLLETRPARTLALTIPARAAGRYFLEDDRGVRLADLHNDSSQAVTLSLPQQRQLFMHDVERHREYLLDPTPGRRSIASLASRPSTHRVKGAAEVAFTQIFARPFTLTSYRRAMVRLAQADPWLSQNCVQCTCVSCDPGQGAPLPASPSPEESTAPPPPPPVAVPPPSAMVGSRPAGRRLDEKALSVFVGTGLFGRSFAINDPVRPSSPSDYGSGAVFGFGLGLELYPLAFFGKGGLCNVGLSAHFQRDVALRSRLAANGGDPLPTSALAFSATLRYRWNILGRPRSPVLRPGLGFGQQVFSIDWPSDLQGSVPLPNITHTYLRISFLGLEVPLFVSASERFSLGLSADFDYLHVFSSGDIERPDSQGYGRASAGGLDVSGGLFLRFSWVFVRALGYYNRYFMSFDHDSRCTSCNTAGGALEVYQGFRTEVGFHY